MTSFVVLTGTVTTQQLQVRQEVASNYRSTYDILVRPRGSATALETADGVVRSNFLAGQYGGISLKQVKQISAVPGVDVAAPVAVLGQTMRNVLIPIDMSKVLGNRNHAMVRFSLVGSARNNTATTTNQRGYLYLTRQVLTSPQPTGDVVPDTAAQLEQRAGRTITACLASTAGKPPVNPADAFQENCTSIHGTTANDTPPRVEVLFSLPLTVEAIDPDAEAKLTGLDQAITQGRPLAATDGYGTDRSGPAPVAAAAAVIASQLPFDYQATIKVQELSQTTIEQVLGSSSAQTRAALVTAATPARTIATVHRDAAQTYRSDIAATVDTSSATADQSLITFSLDQPGQIDYASGRPLQPKLVPFNVEAWRDRSGDGSAFLPAPPSISDTGYRTISAKEKSRQETFVSFRIVGEYNADKLPRPSRLNEVPLETYRPSYVEGANAASRAALGNKPMLSDLNPAGYVQSPPALLVPIKALPLFWQNFSGLNQSKPVSSVRVRVAGITGLDPISREKVREIAQQIQTSTGLDVDITIGSSLQNRQVALPATRSGTPALLVNERWTKKGVAVAISQALDAKSLVLFLVILASSALTVALIATASVQTRRRELAVLACLGWRASKRRTLVAAELLIIGLTAGVLGAAAAWPIAHVLGIRTVWWQILLAVPLGALLAVLPGLAATIAAGQVAPIDAFRTNGSSRRVLPLTLTGPGTLGLIMISRRPSRIVLGGLAVALAVASTTLLAGILKAFHGAVIGSFLGNAVALQVRTPDVIATVLLIVLGLAAVTTVLLIAVSEDAPAYAALHAIGWTDSALTRTLLSQAVLIGFVGAVLGTAVALGAVTSLIGALSSTMIIIAAGVFGVAVLASCLGALIPAAITARIPAARVLARD
ncbi:MAG: FtsX-like permease family protein [Nakamurella sp.]